MNASRNDAVLILGAAGQLGQTMVAYLGERWPIAALTRGELDVTDAAAVRRVLHDRRPRAIVNCAGYNQVDRAEDEPQTALDVNAVAVLALARGAAEIGATLVHYSSDFVFNGEADRPYREADRPDPRSVYAASKLVGEWFAADAPAHYVLRVESLFGGARLRKSSLDRILDALADGRPVRAFADRTVSPTYAWDVAAATDAVLRTGPPPGLYHCVNTGAATWHDVALAARRLLGSTAPVEPIRMADVALPAARPRYCALANDKLRQAGIAMPTWEDALERCVRGPNVKG